MCVCSPKFVRHYAVALVVDLSLGVFFKRFLLQFDTKICNCLLKCTTALYYQMRVLKCLCVLDIGIGLALLLCIFLVSTNPWVALKTSFLSGPVNLGWAPPESHVQFDEHFSASSVVFISCNRQGMPNPFWDVIAALNPTGIIWMGDNVYGN